MDNLRSRIRQFHQTFHIHRTAQGKENWKLSVTLIKKFTRDKMSIETYGAWRKHVMRLREMITAKFE